MTTPPTPPQEPPRATHPLEQRGGVLQPAPMRGSSAWLGAFLAFDAAVLVIVGLFLTYADLGFAEVKGWEQFTRIDIVLTVLAVVGALFVLLAAVTATRGLALVGLAFGMLIIGQVFPTENANELDVFGIGFWLVLAGGVVLTIASLVTRAGIRESA